MASTPPRMNIAVVEPPSVSVFVRPLEVSVPVLDSPPAPPSSNPPPKTYISTMTSRIETETSIKRWSTPQVKHEEGHPPGPEDHPETKEGRKLEGIVKTITPSYKLGEDKPVHDIRLGSAGHLPSGTGDYKLSMRQEDYKQTVIDPKVRSNANMPLSSMKLPDARRALADDFPSEHSKRSQIKLEPLEQRRFKSVERRPVSTSSYLTESVNRHRDADNSILHPYLKAKEGDASKPWNKPNWPGPKKNADDEKMRELEIMKQKLETIQKKAKASSMHNLSLLSPDEFGKTIVVDQPSPTLHDIGALIKMRKERYLDTTKQMRKTKSENMLSQLPPKEDWSHSDLAHRQLRKEFHLSQYAERRASWSQEVRSGPSKHPPEGGAVPQVEEPRTVHLPVSVAVKVDEERRKPRGPEEDYPERLMSPPPTKEPRSILKSERSQQRYDYRYSSEQQYRHQHYEEFRERRENGTPRAEPPPPPPPVQAPPVPHPAYSQGPPIKPTSAPPPPPAQPMRPRSTTFQDLPEEERYRIMQENLMKHRQHRPTTPKQPTSSFNGPFFKLEEVTPGASGAPYRPPTTNGYSLKEMKTMSQSEMELEQHFHRSEEPQVVVWPPPSDKQRPRSQSVMSKNMKDPERIEELRRQQAMEREAMQRHDDEKMRSMAKQIRAMQIQQERLYEQQHGVTSPVPMMPMAEDPNAYMTDMEEEAPGHPHHQPPNMRIFETRPISSMSDAVDMPTWKRTYVVERPQDVAKNEIITSDELLQRDQYEVDILKRRDAFVEKMEAAPEILRTGRRWQPPPDKPYVWPTLRRPISVEPHLTSPIDFPPGAPQEEDEYKWAPVVNEPGYRRERKNFTPTHSPPPSPRRGMSTLDEVNKRQTKYVVQPSPDGSHRPKPAFRKERHPPHGGFYPHAPNAIKVVKRRAASVQNLASPNMEHEDVEIIAQRNYHRVEPVYHQQQPPPSRSASAVDHRLRRDSSHHSSHHELSGLHDWEKIYELPPHSSTIVGKDVPRHVDVRRRLNQFEGSIQNLAERKHLIRAPSVESSNSQPFPPPDYDLTLPAAPKSTMDRHQHQDRQVSRRNSVASGHREESSSRRERRNSRSHSRAPSSILLSPTPRGDTPAAQRARAHIARSTAASPTPPAYDRARAYQPPALPPGYRLADPPPDMRAISPQAGHTKRMVRTVQDSARRIAPTPQTSRAPSRSTSSALQPPKNDDLDHLGRRTAELEERSRAHRSTYKLYDSEIHKTGPAPLPAGLKDQVNELLASRASLNTVERDHDRSGYATDVSTATWQFSTHSFSPRSVVSMNGARDDILKSRVPADLESVTSSARTAPAAFGIRVITNNGSSSDDKPRSIMKRRELESREQMMYPSNQQLVEHKTYQRSQSNVAKPTVTETVQRFEETRRTEEVERRVQRKERRERRSRHHSSSRHGGQWGHDAYLQEQRRVASLPRKIVYQQANRAMTADEMDQVVKEAYEAADDARRHGTRVRSNSLSRALPSTQEAYYRQTTTRRDRDYAGSRYEDEAFGRGLAHARYGSLSDSLRRGELKYIPNGEVRESGHFSNGGQRSMHKSYSTRDVFNGDNYDRRSVSSQRRGSQQQQASPFVEFPPTLPRRSERDAYRPISKSRSYADWDDAGRAGFGGAVRRYDDDMTRLEAEFRDSLLMPMPRGNMNERDHRTEQIPGGYETFDKNKKAQSGRRLGRDGQPVDFHESSQEYNYKREQELDRRR